MFVRLLAIISAIFLSITVCAETKLQITTNKPSAVYELGEDVTWNVEAKDGDKTAAGTMWYVIKRGGLTEVAKGEVQGAAVRYQDQDDAERPAVVLIEVKFKPAGEGKELNAVGAAVFAPERIERSTPVPDDFDAFWKAKIAELDAVPMNVQVEQVDVGDAKIEYFKITMDNIRGRKIYGQLARPVGGEKLPALLQVQWAGVYPLQRDWVLGPARQGRLAFNIIAHDLPIDEDAKFYQEKAGKELADYPGIGNEDRETSYFLPMFLSCRRAPGGTKTSNNKPSRRC